MSAHIDRMVIFIPHKASSCSYINITSSSSSHPSSSSSRPFQVHPSNQPTDGQWPTHLWTMFAIILYWIHWSAFEAEYITNIASTSHRRLYTLNSPGRRVWFPGIAASQRPMNGPVLGLNGMSGNETESNTNGVEVRVIECSWLLN